jgi:hypothetical protein
VDILDQLVILTLYVIGCICAELLGNWAER